MHLVGFIIRIYHDARSRERQIDQIKISDMMLPTYHSARSLYLRSQNINIILDTELRVFYWYKNAMCNFVAVR